MTFSAPGVNSTLQIETTIDPDSLGVASPLQRCLILPRLEGTVKQMPPSPRKASVRIRAVGAPPNPGNGQSTLDPNWRPSNAGISVRVLSMVKLPFVRPLCVSASNTSANAVMRAANGIV